MPGAPLSGRFSQSPYPTCITSRALLARPSTSGN
jgi:hypothetical protein